LLFGVIRKGEKILMELKSYPVENKTFYFNPPFDFEIQVDDILIVMGRKHHIEKLRKQSNKRPPR